MLKILASNPISVNTKMEAWRAEPALSLSKGFLLSPRRQQRGFRREVFMKGKSVC